MPDLPDYPDHTDDHGAGRDHATRASTMRAAWLWAAGIGLVVLVVVLHLTGVLGPGGH